MTKPRMKYHGRVNFDPAKTIQFVSDVHVGEISQAHLDAVTNDKPVAVVALMANGDITNAGDSGEITAALSWLNGVKTPWYVTVGNHDLNGQTVAQFVASYGIPARDYVVDLTFFRLIVLGCKDGASPGTLDADALTFLDASLTNAGSTPCVIATHYPMHNTVLSPDAAHYLTSADSPWYITPESTLLTTIAAHDNAVAWVSGHVHAPYFAPDFVKRIQAGAHYLYYIALSSVHYYDISGQSPIVPSVYICVQPGYIVVKVRDHAKRTFVGGYVLPIRSGLA